MQGKGDSLVGKSYGCKGCCLQEYETARDIPQEERRVSETDTGCIIVGILWHHGTFQSKSHKVTPTSQF